MHEQFPPQPSQLDPTGEVTPKKKTPNRARAIGALASRVTDLIAGAHERRSARKLEKYKQMLGAQQRVNVIGPVADHIAYGLPNSSLEILTTIPLAYPMTPELLEDQRMLIAETKEPGYYAVLTEYSQQKPILCSLILANTAQPVSINPTHLILAANERLYAPWRDARLVL